MTSEYCPARFGASDRLIPSAPWHIVQFSAKVPPRPTASLGPPFAIERSSTTLVETTPALTFSLLSVHLDGTPAARQMLFHRPCAEKSLCTEGNQTKPTSIDTTVSATSAERLQRSQGLLHEYMPCSRIIGSQSE